MKKVSNRPSLYAESHLVLAKILPQSQKRSKNIESFRNIINLTKRLFGVLLLKIANVLPFATRSCFAADFVNAVQNATLFAAIIPLLIITVLKQTKLHMSAMPVLPEAIAV